MAWLAFSMNDTPSAAPDLLRNTRMLLAFNALGIVVSAGIGLSILLDGNQGNGLGFALLGIGAILGLNIRKLKIGLQDQLRAKELEDRLEEKETYLKEVHHRVKNNLQTVSSLLSLQARAVDDPKISAIIKNSQHRVVTMAMVHEMLYKRDDYVSKIELKPYLEELCAFLIRSTKEHEDQVQLQLNIPDCKLNIDTIIPLGLIINEIVTNALKYGLPGEENGCIQLQLQKLSRTEYQMKISDNGLGFSDSITAQNSKSLGLKLIRNLARQLMGEIEKLPESPGTHYRLLFSEIKEGVTSVD